MKDRDAFLDLMINSYESDTGTKLSSHDPVFHAFNSVANVADILSIYADKEARERYIVTAKRRNSVIAHAIGYGYTPAFLEPDQHVQHIIFSDAIPEDMTIPKGTRVKTEMEDDDYTIAEVMEDTHILAGATEADVNIEVGQTVEVYIGDGDGMEKSLPLEADYVYVKSLTLKVVTPFGTEIWTLVDNFMKSEETDQHFIYEVGAKDFNDMMKPNDLMLYLRCGDGISGKVFPENSQIYAVYKEVNPYQDTMPENVFTVFEDPIMYVETTSNTTVLKEKILPEETEIIRRNAIYTKSIGNTLNTKVDFERGAIIQSVDKINKAYAEHRIEGTNQIYTIYVKGDEPLSQVFLDSVRDKMYTEYARSLNDIYELIEAPAQVATMQITVIYEPDLPVNTKTTIQEEIKSIVAYELSLLDLGQTYSVPVLWNNIMRETKSLLKGLAYLQIDTAPPVVTYNAELQIPSENISFVEA